MAPVPGNPQLLASGIPSISPEIKSRVDQYVSVRSAIAVDQSDDGKQLLITTRFGSTNQLHLVSQPMGARFQLTFADEPILQARFLPGDPQTIFYLRDVGGAEFFQIYRLDRRTGRSELLTDGKSRHQNLVLSTDGRWIAYSGTGRNGRDTDIYLSQVARPQEAKRITEYPGTWHAFDFSSDGKRLLIAQERSAADSDLYLLNLESGEKRQLSPREGAGSVHQARFSRDGKQVYFVTDRYGDFNELYSLDLSATETTPRTLSRAIGADVEHFTLAPDGSQIVFCVNRDGFSELYVLGAQGGKPQAVDVGQSVIGGVHFPRKRSDLLTLSMQTARVPADAWQLDLRSRKLTRWTRSELGGLNESTFVQPSSVRYPSKDGVTVPAFVYRPAKPSAPKLPVVIIWHGGPESQSRPTFTAFAQLLVSELGAAVMLPNVRGSAGYGKKYMGMDDGVKREASLADIGATLDWIGSQPDLDANRVGVYGGSYGGYMVLATAAFFPHRIRAAVDLVGVSSLVSLLSTTSSYRQDLRRAEYGDERIPEVRAVLERISPLNKVDAIEAALFVVQGRNDPRVPMSESEQIVRAVRGKGRDVWYLLGLNEGHGFRKRENQVFSQAASVQFFTEKLLGTRSAADPGASSDATGSSETR
jgi:dipeptidyl aminopeptidase/acylaminoacyl peptidase